MKTEKLVRKTTICSSSLPSLSFPERGVPVTVPVAGFLSERSSTPNAQLVQSSICRAEISWQALTSEWEKTGEGREAAERARQIQNSTEGFFFFSFLHPLLSLDVQPTSQGGYKGEVWSVLDWVFMRSSKHLSLSISLFLFFRSI